ncbi:CynX/NimT family MFS transporter [Paenibacillus wynnii]|uniref:CynX/NimT family MFS transporter n=1 Tax=Paenibacillus wynnii TaxID=268407 RepID=UPI00278D397B|nr:MFS transporter [Paenibacillus wynnii]MDQ0195705.1 CP family cyanate transporter-like MFS transporter [Paenibacillus wynnii]
MKARQQEEKYMKIGMSRLRLNRLWLVLGIIVIAAALRAPFTSVGTLIEMIKEDLGLSNTLAGAITTLPLLAFALVSPFASKFASRFGMANVLLIAMLLLAVSILVRSGSGAGLLFIGTAMLGISIAVCNVLLPSLIKGKFPRKIGLMTGIYTVSMNLCAAFAAGISVPLASHTSFGWRGTLAMWFILAALATMLWIPQIRILGISSVSQKSVSSKNIWRSALAWQVSFFMGLQSLLYYVLIAWFSVILGERGMTSSHAGWILSLMQLAQLPFTFFVPLFAGRLKNQRSLVVITFVLFVIGISGIWLGSSSWMAVWAICIGIAGGFAFGLVMMFFSLRTKTTQEAAELSGMAQSVGYLLAAAGPALFGWLHDLTHSWDLPLILLLGASVMLLLVGLGAGKNRFVGDA